MEAVMINQPREGVQKEEGGGGRLGFKLENLKALSNPDALLFFHALWLNSPRGHDVAIRP